jgi:DNA-binding transcriptional ArsR family regulator
VNTHIDDKLDTLQIVEAANVLKLVSDPTRLKILWALLHGEHSVGALAVHVEAQQAAVSQHLAKLRAAKIVKARRDGNTMYYLAENKHVGRMIKEALAQADHINKELTDNEESHVH